MKKYFFYFIFLFTLFTWGCSDSWIESTPMTELTESDYYKTPKHAWETLMGCYNRLSGNLNFFQAINIAADDCFGGTGKGDTYGVLQWDHFEVWGGFVDQNITTWSTAKFSAIRRCTVLLEVLDGVDWGANPELRTRYEAEARFLRAYYVWSLQAHYGHIPLNRTSNEKNDEQTDPHEVYRYIVDDLKFAINNLPARKFSEAPQDEFGRVTKWAAIAFLSRVYMFYSGYYADSRVAAHFGGVQDIGISKTEVLSYLETLISDSGHELVPRFGSLWQFSRREDYHKDPTLKYAGEYNPEIIFSVRNTTAYTNSFAQYAGIRAAPSPGAYNPWWHGWGMCTINPKILSWYEPGDERRFASIIDVENEWSDRILINSMIIDQRDYTGYYQKKYQVMTASADNTTQSDPRASGGTGDGQFYGDMIIIRYADVLLMAAELGSSNALNYVNQVRDRAFNDQAHRVNSVDIDVIYAERAREFVCEQIRWYDLLRRGLDYAKQELDINIGYTLIQNTADGKNKIIDFPLNKLGLFRIPESEILLGAGKLIQNPGW